MSALVDATLKHSLLPPVVPEFPNITVGGAFSGTAGESSSFRHGLFDRTVNWIEIILASGDVVRPRADDEDEAMRELFWANVGCFGTLGVITLLEVRLKAVLGHYVKLEYTNIASATSADSAVEDLMRQVEIDLDVSKDESTDSPLPHGGRSDFIDAILFPPEEGVLMTGRIVSDKWAAQMHKGEPSMPIRRFSRPGDQWFYLHVYGMLQRYRRQLNRCTSITSELIPIKDYLFRYDISAFWMGANAFPLWHLPFNRVTRTAAYPFLHTKTLYAALHLSGGLRKFIIQDCIMPSGASAAKLIQHADARLGISPIWLCPIRGGSPAPMHSHARLTADGSEPELLINVGVWGAPHAPPPSPFFPSRALTRGYNLRSKASMEKWLEDNRALETRMKWLGGKKCLYAQTFYEDEEKFFEGIGVDKEWYNDMRSRFNSDHLPGIWDKVGAKGKVDTSRGKLNKGRALTALVRKEYLRPKK